MIGYVAEIKKKKKKVTHVQDHMQLLYDKLYGSKKKATCIQNHVQCTWSSGSSDESILRLGGHPLAGIYLFFLNIGIYLYTNFSNLIQ